MTGYIGSVLCFVSVFTMPRYSGFKRTRRGVPLAEDAPLSRSQRRYPRPAYIPSHVVSFNRTFYYENWTPSTATTAGFWKYYGFRLNQLPNYTEITALFDRYKINAIKVTFRPRFDNFAGNDTTDTTLPGVTAQGTTMMHIIADPDSIVTPSGTYTIGTLNSFLENGSVKTHDGTKPISVYFRPKVNRTVGAEDAGSRIRAPWHTATNVSHFGFHAFMQDVNMTGTFNQSYDVFVTYYMMAAGLK